MTMLRIVLSFAMVGLLLWLFARASRGRLGSVLTGSIGGSRANPLSVLDRCQLTKGTAVALVRAGERHLLIGIAEGRVDLLAEGSDLITTDSDGAVRDAADDDTTNLDTTIDLAEHAVEHVAEGRALAPAPGRPTTNPPTTNPPTVHPTTDPPGARTRPQGAPGPTPPRTSLIDALRERTVRRS